MKSNSATIKITSGKFKGLSIDLPPSSTTRPTKSIMRESFFNSIRMQLQDSVFVECFGGSGSMGITALSEGAKEAIFFEIDENAAQILKNNLKKLHKFDENATYKIFNADFFTSFERIFSESSAQSIILYLDPPFCSRVGMQNVYEKCFKVSQQILKCSDKILLIALECMSSLQAPQNIGAYGLSKCKKFGKSQICYYNLH